MSNVQRKRIPLEYPIQTADRTIHEIRIRRMTVGDMLACPVRNAQDVEGELRLMARLCDLVPEELHGMDILDYGKLQDALISFRGGGNSTATRADAGVSAAGETVRHEHEGSARPASD